MFVADIMTAAMGLQAGHGEVLWMEQVQVMGPDLTKKGYNVALGPLGMFALIPDSTNPDSPLADKRVREAVEYAIDKGKIANTLGKGYWEPYYTVAPSNTIGYIPGFEGRQYNPTKAKELLTEAGYPNGFKTSLMTYQTGDLDPLLAAQADLKAVGIDMELNIVSMGKYMTAMFNGWESGFFLGMFGHLDPNFSNYMQRYFSDYSTYFGGVGENAMLDRPDNVKEGCEKAMLALTLEDQKAAINETVMAIYEDQTVIPLWTFSHAFATDPKFHDAYFGEPCASYWNWYSSWLEK
jgi:peptide/nickel transport system substrate-binding protein